MTPSSFRLHRFFVVTWFSVSFGSIRDAHRSRQHRRKSFVFDRAMVCWLPGPVPTSTLSFSPATMWHCCWTKTNSWWCAWSWKTWMRRNKTLPNYGRWVLHHERQRRASFVINFLLPTLFRLQSTQNSNVAVEQHRLKCSIATGCSETSSTGTSEITRTASYHSANGVVIDSDRQWMHVSNSVSIHIHPMDMSIEIALVNFIRSFGFSCRNWLIRPVVSRLALNSIKNCNGSPFLSFYCCQLPSFTFWKSKYTTTAPNTAREHHGTRSNDTDTMSKMRASDECEKERIKKKSFCAVEIAAANVRNHEKFVRSEAHPPNCWVQI